MTPPVYLNSSPSPFPLTDLNEDHHQQASSSHSFPISFNITQDQRSSDHFVEPQKDHEYILDVGSSNHRVAGPAYSIHPTVESTTDNNGISSRKLEDEYEDKRDQESSKWMMPKKIRIVQNLRNTGSRDQKQERIIKIKIPDLENAGKCEINSPSHTGNVVRICSDCKTTKTPLWRSGPQGPKSLCNACGIRQRKARRASCQWHGPHNGEFDREERISFEDFALSMSKSLGFRQAFPKDEEEAAMLLMALSCGLLHN